jgi:Ca2+-binding RTX toxin-like protein
VTVVASDGSLTDTQAITVNVTDVAEGPIGAAPTDIRFSLNEANASSAGTNLGANTPLGSFTALDADSSSWTFALTGTGASLFTLSPSAGLQSNVNLLVGGSSVGAGDYSLVITATDSEGNKTTETFVVHVGTPGTDSFTVTSGDATSGTDIDFGLNGTDSLIGGAGDDALVGGQNADNLDGQTGNDELLGGGGNDNFNFQYDGTHTSVSDYGVDRILDMNASGNDTIQLDDFLFSGIGTGTTGLNANAFNLNGGVVDANDRVIYDQATGALLYDADGSGAGAAVLFAQLDAGTALTLSDFQVI